MSLSQIQEITPGMDWGTWKSVDSNIEIKVNFYNTSGEAILINWIKHDSFQKEMHYLPHGGKWNSTTQVNHPWLLKKQDGLPFCLFKNYQDVKQGYEYWLSVDEYDRVQLIERGDLN